MEPVNIDRAVAIYLKAIEMFEADEKKLYSLSSFRQAAGCATKAKRYSCILQKTNNLKQT